jgi:hypothetical protein
VDCSFRAGLGRRKVPQLVTPRTTPFLSRTILPAVLAILMVAGLEGVYATMGGEGLLFYFGEAAGPDLGAIRNINNTIRTCTYHSDHFVQHLS